MRAETNIAFKEWAIVVDALGGGEQLLILRKGGIREQRGEFSLEHRQFWLFPTQFHEAEQSIIPSKRAALRELTAASRSDMVAVQYFAVVDQVIQITDRALLSQLQGRHIWAEHILQQRFDFGRETGLHALITRIYRLNQPVSIPTKESYGGCKSWLQLDSALTGDITPVLDDAEFERQRDELCEILGAYANARL
ncbi:MAG: hypothetical protein PCFJNLEI_00824 [Verrucomicrobiae bacterium]|nr:hypothetical protein [Verrucomicrobiae bacterium]